MNTERYHKEVNSLRLDEQKKQAWIAELSGKSSCEDDADPYNSPYLSPAPSPPSRRPAGAGWVRWAASAAAAVLFAAGSAFVLLPRGGPDTADEGGWESSGDPADTTQPSLSSDVNTAPITTPGDPDVTTTTTQEWVQPTAAFDPDHPLAVFRDPNYTFNRFTEEQVMAIFDAVDTVQQLMDVTQTDVNYVRELWKQEISFAFMTGLEDGTSYSLTENYRAYDLELRYHVQGQEPVVLASKPLPSGSNFVDAYDWYIRNTYEYIILSTQQLDRILADGHVAPVMSQSDTLSSDGIWISPETRRLGFSFYMKELKRLVWIIEDYAQQELRVYFHPADDPLSFEACAVNEPMEVRPLPPDADITDYPTLQEGWDMYSSGSEETIPTTVTSAPSSRAGRIFPTTAGRKLLTMSTLIDLAYSGRTLTWDDFAPYEAESMGSGLLTLLYPVDRFDGEYQLRITGTPDASPYTIVLQSVRDQTEWIDIRTDDIKTFLNR